MRRQRRKQVTRSKKSKLSGCWSCGYVRASCTLKVFGRERAICADCSLLSEHGQELEGRYRELFSFATWDGYVPNKHRRKVELLRKHQLSEISLAASELLAEDHYQRQMSAARRDRESQELHSPNKQYEDWLNRRPDRLGKEVADRFT